MTETTEILQIRRDVPWSPTLVANTRWSRPQRVKQYDLKVGHDAGPPPLIHSYEEVLTREFSLEYLWKSAEEKEVNEEF